MKGRKPEGEITAKEMRQLLALMETAVTEEARVKGELLIGWEEIGRFLRWSPNTAQRQVKRLHLPIFFQHRLTRRGFVRRRPCAFKSSLILRIETIAKFEAEGKIPRVLSYEKQNPKKAKKS